MLNMLMSVLMLGLVMLMACLVVRFSVLMRMPYTIVFIFIHKNTPFISKPVTRSSVNPGYILHLNLSDWFLKFVNLLYI
jgi:hypothetical protein